jgi:preprotein translocase, SecE subunit, bacterial
MPDAKPEVKSVKPAKPVVKKDKKKRTEQIRHFLIDTKAEFKKIVWPAPKQVVHNSVVVLVMIVFVGVLIWGVDALMSYSLNALLSL